MKVWIYRPDKKQISLDYTLLYYKGKTYQQYEAEKVNPKPINQNPIKLNPKIKPHFIEVPF